MVFCSVKFSIAFPILFTCFLRGLRHPPQYPLQKEKGARKGSRMPLRNAFVPIPDIIQILKNLQVTAAPNMLHTLRRFLCETPRAPQLCAVYKQNRRTRRCARGYGGLEELVMQNTELRGML